MILVKISFLLYAAVYISDAKPQMESDLIRYLIAAFQQIAGAGGGVAVSTDPEPISMSRLVEPSWQPTCGVRGPSKHSMGPRIIRGFEANPGEFPWQVFLEVVVTTTGERHTCGGAVVDRWWVVSAAHCVYYDGAPVTIVVTAGEHDLRKREVSEQKVGVTQIQWDSSQPFHPKIMKNDIVMLKLTSPLIFTQWVSPICLPDAGHTFSVGESGVVAGWGYTRMHPAKVLQYANIPRVCRKTCEEIYSNHSYYHSCQVCAGGGVQDSCNGDSGGPLACRQQDGRYYLCGIVSLGPVDCGTGLPAAYTDVSCFSDWIRALVGGANHVSAKQTSASGSPCG